MGAEVHCDSYSRLCYSMRDVNDNPSSSSWSRFYGDKSVPFLQYNNGHIQRTADVYPEHEKDALKQKMFEHEAVFKNQVFELHRLYQIQRNMMEEAKRKDFCSFRLEKSSSSCAQVPQLPSEVAKCNVAAYPLWEKQSAPIAEVVNSPARLHNGSSRNEEAVALNGRLSKVRKTFDLQLPADDYLDIDEGEDLKETSGPEKKLLVDHLGSSSSALCFNGSAKLVDLNEPIRNKGTSASSVRFLNFTSDNITESKSLIQQAKSKGAGFGVSGGSIDLSNGFFTNTSVDGKLHNRSQLSHTYESGFARGLVDSLPQSNQLDRSPFFLHYHRGTPNHIYTPPVHSNSYGKEEDRWREGLRHGYEYSNQNRDCSGSYNGFMASESSHNISSFPFLSSFSSSQAPTMLSWAKNNTDFGRLSSVNPVLEPLPQSYDQFARKMFASSSSRPNPALQIDSSSNGFYHGSASGSKEQQINIQPPGFNFSHFRRFNNVASDCSKPSFRLDGKSLAMAIDLNEEVPGSPSDEVVILEDVKKFEHAGNTPALPWVKPKPIQVNEVAFPSTANGIVEIKHVKKTMGFPIFDRNGQENERSSVASTSASFEGKSASCLRKGRMIDINVACDLDAEEQPVREFIDLNTCASYSEDPLVRDDEIRGSSNKKKMLEIDLEAPYLLESDDDNPLLKESEQDERNDVQDEALIKAAELVLEMSSSVWLSALTENTFSASEVSVAKSLVLLVDSFDAMEIQDGSTTSRDSGSQFIEEMDEFEAMTLQLEETTEEQYIPKPIAPQVQKVEESVAVVSAGRPRRGQTQRGRPRKDFQRDILPGLTSLSRHEMTEDLQIFGNLMRAMGHCWSPGLTRRNGARNATGRGRKRAIVETTIIPAPTQLTQKLSCIEPGSEDRSLTGWGKTTRRPRRQRCSQGNPSSVT